ncbi:MAG: aminopeptidase P family protein [Isosphaeraceae bacterium]
MSDRHAARRDAIRDAWGEGMDAFLVSSRANVGYLTGFSGTDASLLLTRDRAILLSDGRYAEQIARECPGLEARIRNVAESMADAIAGVVKLLGARSVGFEATAVSVAERDDLAEKAPATSWVPRKGKVERLREVKDDGEIAAIREAIDFAEAAFAEVVSTWDRSWTEKRVADALDAAMRKQGASGASFPPIVAAGANAALPHHQPTDADRLGDSGFVLIDWGARGRPYQSDLTRVVAMGKVTPRFEEVYRIVLAAQERALAAIRPGAAAADVDAEARSVIEEAGFGRFFDHGLGHGIGRQVHEAPRIRKGSAAILRPGMVFTVEPGIYLPGWGGLRVEDDVLVTGDGHEVLTRLPRDPGAFLVP